MRAISLLNARFVYNRRKRIPGYLLEKGVSLGQQLTYLISKKRETLDASEYFKDKHVVIIGPCVEQSSDLEGRVTKADVLVVVNKGHRLAQFAHLRRLVRDVVLFHCLDRSENTGGGDCGSFELRNMGFKDVFYPLCEDRFDSKVVEFHRRNYSLMGLRRVRQESYDELRTDIKGYTPNTGYAAIWTIAKGACASLYVSGINFMRNPYNNGYHKHLDSQQKVIMLIEKYGNHNPDMDLESFRELVKANNIKVDSSLAEILARPREFIFYQKRDN